MTQCLMCRFATPETGYSRYIHSWSGLWGWLVLILIAQHSRCISHHDKLLLWWGNGEMSPNHSRTILVYHLKWLFFYLAIRALWDVYPRILVDKELEKEEINTQLRAMVNPSELLPSSPINTFQCLSPVAGLEAKCGCLFLCFILSNGPFSSYAFLLRSVTVQVTLLTLWISDTNLLPIYVNFISWCFPLWWSMQIPGSHNRFI